MKSLKGLIQAEEFLKYCGCTEGKKIADARVMAEYELIHEIGDEEECRKKVHRWIERLEEHIGECVHCALTAEVICR